MRTERPEGRLPTRRGSSLLRVGSILVRRENVLVVRGGRSVVRSERPLRKPPAPPRRHAEPRAAGPTSDPADRPVSLLSAHVPRRSAQTRRQGRPCSQLSPSVSPVRRAAACEVLVTMLITFGYRRNGPDGPTFREVEPNAVVLLCRSPVVSRERRGSGHKRRYWSRIAQQGSQLDLLGRGWPQPHRRIAPR